MSSTAGYVYILINPSLNGIVKIGRTQNNPDERAKELSAATGVPTPFFVAYSSYFNDCNAAEIFVHTRLENNRLAQNREFFRVSVQQAIDAVREAESSLGIMKLESAVSQELKSVEISTRPLAPWKSVFHSANAHMYGIGDTIQDASEALQLYVKATKLGSNSAYWIIGNIYLTGNGSNKDYQKAKAVYLEGTKAGSDLCWAGMATVFWFEDHLDNWNKCWKKYFESPTFLERSHFSEYVDDDATVSSGAYQMSLYVYQAIGKKWEINNLQIILESKAEILGYLMGQENVEIAKRVGNTIFHLSEKVGREVPQKIVSGTTSEYFADYYNKAMGTVNQALKELKSPSMLTISDKDLGSKSPNEIFQMANTLYYSNINDENSQKGIFLYERAALAGFNLAYWKVGRIYSSGHEIVADKEKALKFLNKGVKLGVDLCWTELAYIYAEAKNFDRWNQCWKRYFESKTFQNNIIFSELVGFDKLKSNRLYQMFFYIQQTDVKQKIPFMSIVAKYRKEISELIMQNTEAVCVGEHPLKDIVELFNMVNSEHKMSARDYCQEMLAKIPIV